MSTKRGFDLIIRGGLVVDGSDGTDPYAADVAIDGDRIAGIGDLAGQSATAVIDATGLVVAPGFIDPHTHVETAIIDGRDDALAPALQGVTTILTAPDGFGWAPLGGGEAAGLWAGTAGIHGPRPARLTSSIAGYLTGFEGVTPVNVLPQVPGAAVRYAAMGWSDGPASPAALDRMRGIVRDWVDAGATGLSVGLDYEPGARASESELIALCEVVAERGGSLAAHLRYEDLGRSAGYAELGRIGAATGVRINVAHERLDAIGLAALDAMPAGADVAIETYLYGPSSTQLTICLPAPLRVGGPAALADRMRDPATRRDIEFALAERLAADRADGDRIVFAASEAPDRIGREIHDVAAEARLDVGVFAGSVLIDDPMALFVYHHDGRPDQDRVFERTIAHPATMVASDGIYVEGRMHPRGYGTYPRVLRRFVRETATLSLAQAIHAMTGRTAARYRVPDRGRIEVGRIADLVVFDPMIIADRATFEAPRRPPIGIEYVLVNGRTVVAHGEPTNIRPGRVLAMR